MVLVHFLLYWASPFLGVFFGLVSPSVSVPHWDPGNRTEIFENRKEKNGAFSRRPSGRVFSSFFVHSGEARTPKMLVLLQ